MFTGNKRKNEDIRRIHPVIWMLCGLIAGIGVGVVVMHARAPQTSTDTHPSAVQAIVDSVSPVEIQAAAVAEPGTVIVEIPVENATANCHVTLERTGGIFCTIQSAIDAATQHGDVVVVSGGLYEENLLITGNRELTLRGEGDPVISPISGATIHVNDAALTLTGFTVRGSDTGLFISETNMKHITVEDVTFQVNPLQGYGYGILVQGGRHDVLNISATTFQVGGTAVEMDDGHQHSVSFDHVMFQKPNTVLHIQNGVRHNIGFMSGVAFMTSSTIISVEDSQYIAIDAQGVTLPDAQVNLNGDKSTEIYR